MPEHASLRTDGRAVGVDRVAVAGTRGGSGCARGGQSVVRQCRHLDGSHGRSVARPPRTIRRVELGLPTVQSLVEVGYLGTCVSIAPIARLEGFVLGLDDYSRSSTFGGVSKKENQAVGRSRGGYGTKIHLACDTRGRPLDLRLGPGQEHDSVRAAELLGELRPVAVIADKAYDANAFLQLIRHCKAEALIPPLKVRRVRRRYDKRKYRRRNLIERFVNRLKHYRRVATRYEKTARNFLAFAHIASSLVMLGVIVNTT